MFVALLDLRTFTLQQPVKFAIRDSMMLIMKDFSLVMLKVKINVWKYKK